MFEDTDEDTEDLDLFERSRPPRMSDLNYLTQVVEAGFRTTAEAAQRKGGRSGLDLAAARPRGDAIRAVERLCAAPPGEAGACVPTSSTGCGGPSRPCRAMRPRAPEGELAGTR